MATTTATRETTINLRAPSAQRALIDQAAHLAGKSRTDFMLEAACEKAQQMLLDRTVFALDAAGFQRFSELLDAPLDNREALTRLLNRRAAWDEADQ
ncbi:MAG: DUF1778 domain-containing protein [Paludibacterium sp.]|uniref:type II toxin-antitoxin system TacA family antitoxin n=1 Tax=Paludibacterium sp. TaxID=1917523 RepID=UPI0025F67C29|nr:DUF1778 domain-containing protein [Paludibacterium sp.]MBV8048388.1 DUF1778 domain-containing protein [Paludibacterium sp.]MBV8649807.1 DUF1778 domain-containing protein [Paludibacterium sp.]